MSRARAWRKQFDDRLYFIKTANTDRECKAYVLIDRRPCVFLNFFDFLQPFRHFFVLRYRWVIF